jgi:hypothetical protein
MAREERGGQPAERAPAQGHLVRPRQLVNARARHVLAEVDERPAFAELEHQLQTHAVCADGDGSGSKPEPGRDRSGHREA